MSKKHPVRLFSAVVIALLLMATGAAAQTPAEEATETFDYSDNMTPIGFSGRVPANNSDLNSDLAFWGDHAFQGTYNGFRVLDISDPTDPTVVGVVHDTCMGAQGDVIVWDNVLVRSWDGNSTSAGTCVGIPRQTGLQVFDISDLTAPVAVAAVNLACGSHTASGFPDLDNNRLLIYSSPQSGGCNGVDVVEVPLDDPSAASVLSFLPSGDPTPPFPNIVEVDAPSSAAGSYAATGAAFGMPADEAGVSGALAVVNAGGDNPSQGCGPLIGFPAGAIAIADRGGCAFLEIVGNAQAAGASAVVVVNNAGGSPITLGGSDPDHNIMIPAGMVSMADGNAIKAGLPATGRFFAAEVPENPARACHDTGIILGDVMKAACAGHDGLTVWSMHPDDGGSFEEPVLMWSRSFPGITIGHSAAWSWDGEVLVFGHEPGGGGQAQCQATSSELNRTLFFLDGASGETLGTLLHPRPQGPTENCTWHNYNVVPTDKHYVLVSGNYQSGISVINFSDPTNPFEFAYADPAPLSETSLITGGDWSSYWYNGHIYESDIRRGLIIWELESPYVAGAKKFGHLNPQTQETSFGKSPAFGKPGLGKTHTGGPPAGVPRGPGGR